MAAYCRVSTDHEEQLLSYENQVRYYTEFIENSDLYTTAGIYADEGISATNTKKRENFNRMIADCRKGQIDMIITKSISRFARNTLDCLNYVRELKQIGVGIIFEKENINTLDAKGEVLLTILSSLAQDESRSISENSTWGIRRRFENGEFKMSTKRFLGYDTDEDGNLVINREQAKIVERIYDEFLSGKTVEYIKRIFEKEGIKNWDGKTKWQASTIKSILRNEKYKGDAILQKSYTVDFLTKKRAKNDGEILKYHIEENHEAIIDPLIWEAVQLEQERRESYINEHGISAYSQKPESNPFAGKVICGTCGHAFTRKGWKTRGEYRKVWQCQERYKVKGVQGCTNRHIDEEVLKEAIILTWNRLLEDREELMKKWEVVGEFGNPLRQYRAVQFADMAEMGHRIKEIDAEFVLKTLEHVKIFETGRIVVRFMDGREMECGGE
ncbi:recombinase family protein [Alkalibacter rhizosphaerae]|uniref:Recombinase family protein n=2 Tax=Alkalibacter rhizosphaerae TaxID=2815577 RepID=A0A974XH73_9FIRM|nr:recombinase family protein [Alkalibacter rhizosphaerae]QSX09666.1 recombinase family protein [Alkalibacter rhizosphaerae]